MTCQEETLSVLRRIFRQSKECLATVGLADVIEQSNQKEFLPYFFCVRVLNHQSQKESYLKFTHRLLTAVNEKVLNCACFHVQNFHAFRQDLFHSARHKCSPDTSGRELGVILRCRLCVSPQVIV